MFCNEGVDMKRLEERLMRELNSASEECEESFLVFSDSHTSQLNHFVSRIQLIARDNPFSVAFISPTTI